MRVVQLIIFTISLVSPLYAQKSFTVNLDPPGEITRLITNGDKYAFVSMCTKQGLISEVIEYYVFVEEKRFGPFEEVKDFSYSPNGKMLIFYVTVDGKRYIYIDNNRVGPFVRIEQIRFAPVTNTLSYTVFTGDNKTYVYFGKEKYGPYSTAWWIDFTKDGKQIAYTASEFGSPLFGKVNVYIGTKRVDGPFENVYMLQYSPNNTLYYCIEVGARGYICFNQIKIGPYLRIRSLIFSSDGKNIAYSAIPEGEYPNYYLYANKEKTGPYEKVADLLFSPNNKYLIYSIKLEGLWYICISNQRGVPIYLEKDYLSYDIYEKQFYQTISSDERNFAYRNYENGKWNLYIGTEKIAGPFNDVLAFKFTPDGSRLSFLAYLVDRLGLYTKVIYNGSEYTGSTFNNNIVYLNEDIITIE
jgi:WD40 repeat protein